MYNIIIIGFLIAYLFAGLKPKWNKNYKGNYLESGIDYEVIGNIHEERSEEDNGMD